eukprot:Blabericola_migrator_1__3963@NODE_21_length_22536_cov_99_458098_g18_i0_p2_GENE_NODE_21_length_22536_cov_99_458098_g18_i0NODE_21_length_22536_cov_99_458098_g18_i0_p2_ORF_typecomplete_len894_score105_01DUF3251/PF11622_8/0_085DUF4079/PF13301_6/1_5e03DUF4079/PF13301_6/0_15_NODE_21_length_22536_cov_99_458098_g18_i026625343
MDIITTALHNASIVMQSKLNTLYFKLTPTTLINPAFIQNHLLSLPGIKFVSMLRDPWRVSITWDPAIVSTETVMEYMCQAESSSEVVESPCKRVRKTSGSLRLKLWRPLVSIIVSCLLWSWKTSGFLDTARIPGLSLRVLASATLGVTAFGVTHASTAPFLMRNLDSLGLVTSIHFYFMCGSILVFLGLTMTFLQLLFWSSRSPEDTRNIAIFMLLGTILLSAPRVMHAVLWWLRIYTQTTTRRLYINFENAVQDSPIMAGSILDRGEGDELPVDCEVLDVDSESALASGLASQPLTSVQRGTVLMAGQTIEQGRVTLRALSDQDSSLREKATMIADWQPLVGGEAAQFSRRTRFIARWLGFLVMLLTIGGGVVTFLSNDPLGGSGFSQWIERLLEGAGIMCLLPFSLTPSLLYDLFDAPMHAVKQRLYTQIGVLMKNSLDMRRLKETGTVVVAIDRRRCDLDVPSDCFFGVKLSGRVRSVELHSGVSGQNVDPLLKVGSMISAAAPQLPSVLPIRDGRTIQLSVMSQTGGPSRVAMIRQAIVLTLVAALYTSEDCYLLKAPSSLRGLLIHEISKWIGDARSVECIMSACAKLALPSSRNDGVELRSQTGEIMTLRLEHVSDDETGFHWTLTIGKQRYVDLSIVPQRADTTLDAVASIVTNNGTHRRFEILHNLAPQCGALLASTYGVPSQCVCPLDKHSFMKLAEGSGKPVLLLDALDCASETAVEATSELPAQRLIRATQIQSTLATNEDEQRNPLSQLELNGLSQIWFTQNRPWDVFALLKVSHTYWTLLNAALTGLLFGYLLNFVLVFNTVSVSYKPSIIVVGSCVANPLIYGIFSLMAHAICVRRQLFQARPLPLVKMPLDNCAKVPSTKRQFFPSEMQSSSDLINIV